MAVQHSFHRRRAAWEACVLKTVNLLSLLFWWRMALLPTRYIVLWFCHLTEQKSFFCSCKCMRCVSGTLWSLCRMVIFVNWNQYWGPICSFAVMWCSESWASIWINERDNSLSGVNKLLCRYAFRYDYILRTIWFPLARVDKGIYNFPPP